MERSYLRETWFSPYSHRFSLNKNEAAPNTAFDDFKALLAIAHANGMGQDTAKILDHFADGSFFVVAGNKDSNIQECIHGIF